MQASELTSNVDWDLDKCIFDGVHVHVITPSSSALDRKTVLLDGGLRIA